MTILDALLEARRRAVSRNETQLVLTRTTTKINERTGGLTATETDLATQSARLVKPKQGVDPEQVTTAGKITKVEWLVLFNSPDADVSVGDTFKHPISGSTCTVIGISTTTSHGSIALITALAAEVK